MLSHDVPPPRQRRITRDEYHRMERIGLFHGERVELIHGILLQMAPIGPPHADVVDFLNELFVPRLARRAKVRIQQPLLAWDESEPEPDVALVRPGRYSGSHPDEAFLVVEVAETSLDYDRNTKAPLYARSGVAEYWIVDLADRSVLVHTGPAEEGYQQVSRVGVDGSVAPAAFPDVTVAVADLFG